MWLSKRAVYFFDIKAKAELKLDDGISLHAVKDV